MSLLRLALLEHKSLRGRAERTEEHASELRGCKPLITSTLHWRESHKDTADGNCKLWKLTQEFAGSLVVRPAFEQVNQDGARFCRVILQCINAREVQIRLIKVRRYPDRLLETRHGLIGVLGPQVKYA